MFPLCPSTPSRKEREEETRSFLGVLFVVCFGGRMTHELTLSSGSS